MGLQHLRSHLPPQDEGCARHFQGHTLPQTPQKRHHSSPTHQLAPPLLNYGTTVPMSNYDTTMLER